MKIRFLGTAIAGLGVGLSLILTYGWRSVGDALSLVGWRGVAIVSAIHFVAVVPCAWAWRVLLIGEAPAHAYLVFFWARWFRDSVANLIGIVPCAGEIAGARELMRSGITLGAAGATTVIDVTAELVSQLLFTLVGVAVFVELWPGTTGVWWASACFTVAMLAIVGFVAAQKNGLFRVLGSLPDRFGFSRLWQDGTANHSVHDAIQIIYSQPWRTVASVSSHLAAWFAGCLEALIVLRLMGCSLSTSHVIALEALIHAVRAAAFVVPSAIGVQEGGYIFLSSFFGVSPEFALALSLVKRSREVAVGVPALIIWHCIETYGIWRQLPGEYELN